jgi:hypothetical protein
MSISYILSVKQYSNSDHNGGRLLRANEILRVLQSKSVMATNMAHLGPHAPPTTPGTVRGV